MINLVIYNDLAIYKKEIIPFLEEYEVENNLLLGILMNLSENSEKPKTMGVVYKNNDIALAILQTHPRQIVLSKTSPLAIEDIYEIGELLNKRIQEIPGFIGERQFTTELAGYIGNLKGTKGTIEMDQRIYKLEKVQKQANTNGFLRRIVLDDLPIIKEWVFEFCRDVHQPISIEEAGKKSEGLIEIGRLMGWEVNGELVSMSNATRPTNNNININYVFTPVNKRKKGYATDCVSAFTQVMLDSGFKMTSLYTDLSNPTSNKIYMEIGYKPVMDSIVIHFK